MTPYKLKKWQKDMDFNVQQAAEKLGITSATFYNYISGKGKLGIPHSIDLACNAIAKGIGPYSKEKENVLCL